MSHERPFSHENANLPPYPYNVPGLSADAFRSVQEQIRMYRQQEHLPSLTHALIHQWCWEARLAEHGTMPIDSSQQHRSVDTQRPHVEYVPSPNGYLPKLVFPTKLFARGAYVPTPNGYVYEYRGIPNPERNGSQRRSAVESEHTLTEAMAAAGHACYTLMKTAMQHPELTPEHLATVNDFAFVLHQALLTINARVYLSQLRIDRPPSQAV